MRMNNVRCLFALASAMLVMAANADKAGPFVSPHSTMYVPIDGNKFLSKPAPLSEYPLLKETERNYLVLVGVGSNATIGMIAKNDRMMNPTANVGVDTVQLRTLANVQMFAGFVPLEPSKRYKVVSEDANTYRVLFTYRDYSREVDIPKTNAAIVAEVDKTKSGNAPTAKGTLPQPSDRQDITLLNKTVYKGCKVTRVEPDGITVNHASGVAKVLFVSLPKDLQDKYGYDPTNAVAYSERVRQLQQQYAQQEIVRKQQQQEQLQAQQQAAAAAAESEREARLERREIQRQHDVENAIIYGPNKDPSHYGGYIGGQ
ncbi:MAG TPA: hypothetical protein PLE77_07200 [Kiritimatiellia bacterium]|nr:hypothetical protein [Kiritimatiellia bacterium]